MAKRSKPTEHNTATAGRRSVPGPTLTQRAYTLRLRGTDRNDRAWRGSLWATHEAINQGARAFGDWLLTLRGGLSHRLAEPPPLPKGKKRTEEETAALRKSRRILLALSWLSVEDEHGAPSGAERIATGRDADSVRREKVLAALRLVLAGRRISKADMESWVADCAESISANIREDAVWVNRSECFDLRCGEFKGLTREYADEIVISFFGPIVDYFALPDTDADDAGSGGGASDGPEFRTLARQWASTNFGTGEKSDSASIINGLRRLVNADLSRFAGSDKAALVAYMSKTLGGPTPDIDGVRIAVGWKTGRPSKGRLAIDTLPDRVTKTAIETMQAKFGEEAVSKEKSAGLREVPVWMHAYRERIEKACGIPFVGKRNHIGEFSVMLDHAARRVSIGHSWIKRAEAERSRFEKDAKRLAMVPSDAAKWLNSFIENRSGTSGAAAAGGAYRIRRRAIEGWDEVVKRWKRASCRTEEDRIAAAREAQSDPDIDKFGDIQLFEALAHDDAVCVWKQEGKATTDPLQDYVLGHDARDKQRRFKVPAYRHPDPLRHPVFGDFGNSRWSIQYAAHESAKAAGAKRKPSAADAAWLKDRHGLRLGLWNGAALGEVDMRWSSKRLTKDLGLHALGAGCADGAVRDVTRADRLGRAASGLGSGEVPSAAGLFALDDWNGRLQAPRLQLDAIADRVATRGWDATAKAMRDRIEWLISFSAKLECRGPYIEYANSFSEDATAKPFVSRNGELAVKHESNKDRRGHAKLVLSRLPGLRILSVDLGHRFAASCAVWESLSSATLKNEISGCTIVGGGAGKADLFLHTRRVITHSDSDRTTIYRRIGPDTLADGKPHPAPWARLDRQFLIKLQGEDAQARKSSPSELREVESLENSLGRVRDQHSPLSVAVDELMAEAVRTLRLSLRRLGDAARIAYAFSPAAARHTPGGGSEPHTPESRQAAIFDALMRWSDLAHGDRWKDEWAACAWKREIRCDVPALAEDADRWERKRHRTAVEERLTPIAAELARSGTQHLSTLWANHWMDENAAWRPRLKWLRNWILPRGLRARTGEAPAQAAARKSRSGAARNVGGLSLTRIATIRELYQVQKAYAMRPEPDDPRRNIAARGNDRFDEFGRSVLEVMERLREQRVKQTASRIVEAALGVGRHVPSVGKGRDRKRPQTQTDRPCHAVVIENLRNYRPDELQTRRENKQLMSWSSGKVRKYLEEACQLHGLHLREVMPNYTSRQCSRTGLPGMRCVDVPVNDFLNSRYWTRVVSAAKKRLDDSGTDTLDLMLCDLHTKWSSSSASEGARSGTVRIPKQGGDLFVAAPPSGATPVKTRCRGAVQADLNAAANVGLRALLDPDFAAKWWYVPCDSASGQPTKDKCAGAACLNLESALPGMKPHVSAAKYEKKQEKETRSREVSNAWRDSSATDTADGDWMTHGEYWAKVKFRVVRLLRVANGLGANARAAIADAAVHG